MTAGFLVRRASMDRDTSDHANIVTPTDAVSWIADGSRLELVEQALMETSRLHDALHAHSQTIARAAWLCWNALSQGRTVLTFGNGGSAAESQHFAAELSGRFARERRALAAVALTTDTSALTAIANDYGFHRVFGRQIEALGRAGDVAVGISTSGRSPNVLDGLVTARAGGLTTIALTGPEGADLEAAADLLIAVPGVSTARVQEGQLTVLHIICDLVEREVARG